MNATIYDSPGRLKNIYMFLGGINLIVAAYSVYSKSEHENYYFGEGVDLNPFAYHSKDVGFYGANLSFSF